MEVETMTEMVATQVEVGMEYEEGDTALRQELHALHPCVAEVHVLTCRFFGTGRI
jgi:hypothetical protein